MTGSGPNTTVLALEACTSPASQWVGKTPGATPSNTKPLGVVCQRTAVEAMRACARPDSSNAASRCASRSSWVSVESRSARLTPAVANAMMATTINSSNRVKPRAGIDCCL